MTDKEIIEKKMQCMDMAINIMSPSVSLLTPAKYKTELKRLYKTITHEVLGIYSKIVK